MAAMPPESIRVRVCSPDQELRAWLLDELALMTWIGPLDLDCVDSLAAEDVQRGAVDLVIVGVDGLPDVEVAMLRGRSWAPPVIAIGATRSELSSVVDRAFGANVTSRQLKQAIRELVVERRGAAVMR
jgi:hypothetical protein